MKTKLLLAAAISALSLGAGSAEAAPLPAFNEGATQSTESAVEPVYHYRRYWYGYYYYYYTPYTYCFVNRWGYYVCRYY